MGFAFDFAISARYYGLIPDIDSPTVRASNDVAILDIQNQWPDVYSGAGPRVQFERGVYYFGGRIRLKKPVYFEGSNGRFSMASTVFVVPDDTGGLSIESYNDTGRVSQSVYGVLKDIRITTRSSHPTVQIQNVRLPSTDYDLDDIIVPDFIPGGPDAVAWGYAYKCTVAGQTSADINGSGWKTANPEVLFAGRSTSCTLSNGSADVVATLERPATFTNGSADVGVLTIGMSVGRRVRLVTTGTLPTNFSSGVDLFIKTVSGSGVTLSATLGGAAIVAGSDGSGTHAMTGHLLEVGDRCRLDNSNNPHTLPTNFTWLTDYYVKTAPDATTVTLSATSGGAAIVAGSAGSGTHTIQRTTVPDMSPFMDGSVEWTPLYAPGLDVRGTGWRFDRVSVVGFPGATVSAITDALGNAQLNMANLTRFVECEFGYSGHGVVLYGGDTNACSFLHCDFEYARGYHIYDRAGARNTFTACHFAYSENGVWSNTSSFHDNYNEGQSSPPWVFKGSARWRGGTPPTAAFINAAGFTGIYNDGFVGPVSFSALPASGVAAGTLVTPSTPNGQIYYVYTSTGSGAKGAEPTWPLGFVMLETGVDLDRKNTPSGDLVFRPWGLDSQNNSNGDYEISADHNGSQRYGGLGANEKPYFRAGSNSNNNYAFTVQSLIDSNINWNLLADRANLAYILQDEASHKPFGWTVAGHTLGAGIFFVQHSQWFAGSTPEPAAPPTGVIEYWDGTNKKWKKPNGTTGIIY
jgi:hypothetical protein